MPAPIYVHAPVCVHYAGTWPGGTWRLETAVTLTVPLGPQRASGTSFQPEAQELTVQLQGTPVGEAGPRPPHSRQTPELPVFYRSLRTSVYTGCCVNFSPLTFCSPAARLTVQVPESIRSSCHFVPAL